MELYVYASNRALLGIVESYDYLRWTRRYSECGGFELQAIANENNLKLLQIGHILWKNDDEEAGFIEHIELIMEEQEFVLVRGRFATGILNRRIVWHSERLRGDVSEAVSKVITNHLIDPANTDRRIAGFAFDSPNLGIPINTSATYRNLLDVVENLCGTNDLGIKTVWNPSEKLFTFKLYKGTESQAVFSREFENLTEQNRIESLLDYKTVALIGGEGEGSDRILTSVGNGNGIDRYELFVDAKDLQQEEDVTYSDYLAMLEQRGHSKIAEHAPVDSFDATINPHGNLRYKTDYDIGHMVRVVSKKWGVTLTARITEIEESYDRDGQSLRAVFGKGLLTLSQKMKGVF